MSFSVTGDLAVLHILGMHKFDGTQHAQFFQKDGAHQAVKIAARQESVFVRFDAQGSSDIAIGGIEALLQTVEDGPGFSRTRVSVALQFTSQVAPPSSENACSKWHEFAVMSDITNRTKIALPSSASWSKNSPRPFLNSPIVGWLSDPPALLAKLRLH